MAQWTISLGKGLDALSAKCETFSDMNAPEELEDLGRIDNGESDKPGHERYTARPTVRVSLDGATWIHLVAPDTCPGCKGTGLNELQRFCNGCVMPAVRKLHEKGAHPGLSERSVAQEHRGRKVKQPYKILDLRSKAKPRKKKEPKPKE